MINTKELRRLAQAALIGPDGFSMRWRGLLQDFQEEANPSVICELLDRLEVAEKEVAHIKEVEFPRKASAVAVGWETKCARLEQERDNANAAAAGIALQAETLQAERDALRARIETMEKQEPVAFVDYKLGNCFRWAEYLGWQKIKDGARLYALPGAQPTPSVPEGWQLVPTAESRHPGIYKMLGALHAADNTPGMSEWESYRAMLAAAPKPESKP